MTATAWIALGGVVLSALVAILRITSVVQRNAVQMAGKVESNSSMLNQTMKGVRQDIQKLDRTLEKIDERQRAQGERVAVLEAIVKQSQRAPPAGA